MTKVRPIRKRVGAIPQDAIYSAAIHNLLARFFEAFDEKNWSLLRECLSDELYTDYSSFSEMAPSTVPAEQYVERRRRMLDWLDTQHSFQNLHVKVDEIEGTATARCNYAIRRFHPALAGTHYFHSYGHYYFDFVNRHGAWKIARITQHVLRNEGNRDVHVAMWCA